MAENVIVDAGFVVALLSRRDSHHRWAVRQAERFPPPWKTCESVLSEAFHLIGAAGPSALSELIRRKVVIVEFDFNRNFEAVLRFIQKYEDLPTSLSDACLVRMTETLSGPLILTTDRDFHVYRRHGRQTVPCLVPT